MGIRFFYMDSGSSNLTRNGEFKAYELPANYKDSVCVVCAYDSEGNIVTPNVGNATFSMAPISGQFHDQENFIVNLNQAGPIATYEMPRVFGPVVESKLVLSGVDFAGDGIDHINAYIWRC